MSAFMGSVLSQMYLFHVAYTFVTNFANVYVYGFYTMCILGSAVLSKVCNKSHMNNCDLTFKYFEHISAIRSTCISVKVSCCRMPLDYNAQWPYQA